MRMSLKNVAVFALMLGLSLSGCGRNDLVDPPVFLGDFRMGTRIVDAKSAEMVPISRPATASEWETALTRALDDRFGRYTGAKSYRVEVFLDGYNLAGLSVPVVVPIKSIAAVTVHLWDETSGTKLNGEKGDQLIVLENTSPQSLIGSGLTQTKEQQLERMSFAVTKEIERHFLRHPEWFGLPKSPPSP